MYKAQRIMTIYSFMSGAPAELVMCHYYMLTKQKHSNAVYEKGN